MRAVALSVLLVSLAACSSDPAPSRACTPGAQVSCACPGGAAGVQVCAADGSGLGACACPDAGADVPPADVALEASTPEASVDAVVDVVADAPAEASVDAVPEASGPCVDRDGDGYGAGCATGPDCDDTNRFIHPGAPELCSADGADDNCDGRRDGDGDGGVDPLANEHCARIWPYGDGGAPGPRCYPNSVRSPCGVYPGFICVACRAPGDCFQQFQRPGETYDIRACRP